MAKKKKSGREGGKKPEERKVPGEAEQPQNPAPEPPKVNGPHTQESTLVEPDSMRKRAAEMMASHEPPQQPVPPAPPAPPAGNGGDDLSDLGAMLMGDMGLDLNNIGGINMPGEGIAQGACPEPPVSRGSGIAGPTVRQELDALQREANSQYPDIGLTIGPGYYLMDGAGLGGLCAVYKGRRVRDTGDGKVTEIVAVKIPYPRFETDDAMMHRMIDEVHVSLGLAHPNIMRYIDGGRDRRTGKVYLVMEYIDGPTFEAAELDTDGVVDVAIQIANALHAAHSDYGVIHRDVKPGNIMLTSDGVAKLTDFGLGKEVVKKMREGDSTVEGTVLGTPSYISPEQARGERDLTPRSDIYSFGATLYHKFGGRPPHVGESAADVCVKVATNEPIVDLRELSMSSGLAPVPRKISELIMCMLKNKPEDRPESADEVRRELEVYKSITKHVRGDEGTRTTKVHDKEGSLKAVLGSIRHFMEPDPQTGVRNYRTAWNVMERGRVIDMLSHLTGEKREQYKAEIAALYEEIETKRAEQMNFDVKIGKRPDDAFKRMRRIMDGNAQDQYPSLSELDEIEKSVAAVPGLIEMGSGVFFSPDVVGERHIQEVRKEAEKAAKEVKDLKLESATHYLQRAELQLTAWEFDFSMDDPTPCIERDIGVATTLVGVDVGSDEELGAKKKEKETYLQRTSERYARDKTSAVTFTKLHEVIGSPDIDDTKKKSARRGLGVIYVRGQNFGEAGKYFGAAGVAEYAECCTALGDIAQRTRDERVLEVAIRDYRDAIEFFRATPQNKSRLAEGLQRLNSSCMINVKEAEQALQRLEDTERRTRHATHVAVGGEPMEVHHEVVAARNDLYSTLGKVMEAASSALDVVSGDIYTSASRIYSVLSGRAPDAGDEDGVYKQFEAVYNEIRTQRERKRKKVPPALEKNMGEAPAGAPIA